MKDSSVNLHASGFKDGSVNLQGPGVMNGTVNLKSSGATDSNINIQGPYSRTITIYRRLRIGRDVNLDQSEAYDIS